MPSPAKILFLEIDAAEHSLARRWAEAGLMPNLATLLSRGLTGRTISPTGLFVGALWPSFYTGVSPARHGIHSWEQLKPGTYEFFRCITPAYVKREPFWNELSRAGRRVAIFDIPHSGVSTDLNGIQSVEWGAHDANCGFATWPASLADEIVAKFGRHPVSGSCNAERTTADFIAFRDALVRGVERKADLTCHYLRQGGWDFFAQVFTETHCVGHQCWHLHDPRSPRHDPAVASVTGDPVRDVYVAIDAAIGRILAVAGQDALVTVLMGHGMGFKYGPYFLLPDILLRLGVAAAAPVPAPDPAGRAVRSSSDAVLSLGWRAIPPSLRDALRPIRDRLRGWIDQDDGRERPGGPRHLDPAASRCFIIDNNHIVGGLRLNRAGREPGGLLQPGAALRAFCTQLEKDLLDIVDLDSGQPAIRRVLRTADLYAGNHLDDLPDLLVEWNPDIPVGRTRLASPKIGVLEGEYRFCRTGDHRPDGMFAAVGPGLAAGAIDRPISIMDFAPTFARLLEVDLPDVDGRAIEELSRALIA